MGKHQISRTKQSITEQTVTTYMKEMIVSGAHRQHGCDAINLTTLAEDAADQFGITTETIPEEFFDWSLAVAEWYEQAKREAVARRADRRASGRRVS